MKINNDMVIQKLIQQNAQLTFANVQLETILEQYQSKEKEESDEK